MARQKANKTPNPSSTKSAPPSKPPTSSLLPSSKTPTSSLLPSVKPYTSSLSEVQRSQPRYCNKPNPFFLRWELPPSVQLYRLAETAVEGLPEVKGWRREKEKVQEEVQRQFKAARKELAEVMEQEKADKELEFEDDIRKLEKEGCTPGSTLLYAWTKEAGPGEFVDPAGPVVEKRQKERKEEWIEWVRKRRETFEEEVEAAREEINSEGAGAGIRRIQRAEVKFVTSYLTNNWGVFKLALLLPADQPPPSDPSDPPVPAPTLEGPSSSHPPSTQPSTAPTHDPSGPTIDPTLDNPPTDSGFTTGVSGFKSGDAAAAGATAGGVGAGAEGGGVSGSGVGGAVGVGKVVSEGGGLPVGAGEKDYAPAGGEEGLAGGYFGGEKGNNEDDYFGAAARPADRAGGRGGGHQDSVGRGGAARVTAAAGEDEARGTGEEGGKGGGKSLGASGVGGEGVKDAKGKGKAFSVEEEEDGEEGDAEGDDEDAEGEDE